MLVGSGQKPGVDPKRPFAPSDRIASNGRIGVSQVWSRVHIIDRSGEVKPGGSHHGLAQIKWRPRRLCARRASRPSYGMEPAQVCSAQSDRSTWPKWAPVLEQRLLAHGQAVNRAARPCTKPRMKQRRVPGASNLRRSWRRTRPPLPHRPVKTRSFPMRLPHKQEHKEYWA